MLRLRAASERGHFDFGWLDTHHTFSFGDYYDAEHMGHRVLRVLNDDRVAPGRGFGTHPHRDMEILTYVLEGALEHKDSMGNGSVIRPGDVQRMTAGTGVRHSERNHSDTEGVHFLQIWIVPEARDLAPGYEQKSAADFERRDRLRLVASRDGREGSVIVHQNVSIFAGILAEGCAVSHAFESGRHGYLFVARGSASVGSLALREGDGLAISDEKEFALTANAPCEVLLFDLP